MEFSTRIERCTPVIRVASFKQAMPFYRSIGFSEDWRRQVDPAFPVFAALSRDGVALYLSEHAEDGAVGIRLMLDVADVDQFHAECTRNGVHIFEPPQDTISGTRQMSLRDVDGNILTFVRPLSQRLF
ncbi:glyoxalase superfamily protein [Hoeflea poritis]|uniref:Bleomycin resistance protein n=1 Tax=Hoeflea poritis TaxID=2993659 RepID=A0ABT4VHR9_9HYPH|nr:glyoxalase superfamily protein [Hoeflea poritis]MDA4844221.1 glyoxalase superfamily protein [Hoeflea poritis]